MTGKEYLSKYFKTHNTEDCMQMITWLMQFGIQHPRPDIALSKWLEEDQPMCNPIDVEEKKFGYQVSLSAEGISSGTVYLTKEEANIVNYATNPSNWEDAKLESWSGNFFIYTDVPYEI